MRIPFFQKKKEPKKSTSVQICMVLLPDTSFFNDDEFLQALRSFAGHSIGKLSRDESAAVTEIDGGLVAIGSMPVPVPWGDFEGTAQYAYNWETALEDLRDHQAHLIVSVSGGSDDVIKQFWILTAVTSALLRVTNAIGVYEGTQSLLIPKEDYLAEVEKMGSDSYPLNLWVYFGLRQDNGKNAGYTYGLKEFGKRELEILNSDQSLGDIRNFLYNIGHYLIASNVEFEDGQTCGMSAEEKVKISVGPGQLVDSEVSRLAY